MAIPSNGVSAAMRNMVGRLPLSVNALAKEAGVAQPVLWRILNGERRATSATAAKIAAALEAWAKDATAAAKALRRAIRTQGRKR